MVHKSKNQIATSGDKIMKPMKSGMKNGVKITEKDASKSGVINGKLIEIQTRKKVKIGVSIIMKTMQ